MDSGLYTVWGFGLACALAAATVLGALLLWVLIIALRTEHYTRRCLAAAEQVARDSSATGDLEVMNGLARDLLSMGGRIEEYVSETGDLLGNGPVRQS